MIFTLPTQPHHGRSTNCLLYNYPALPSKMTHKHVVMFSGGVGSWMTAKRVAEQHGSEQMFLLFADTLIEDPDLYRFTAEAVGGLYPNTPTGEIRKAVALSQALETELCLARRKHLIREWQRVLMDACPKFIVVCDGRTPWEVFEDERFIGNSRVDPCSRVLKREILNRWRDTNCDLQHTTIYVGIDWTEQHRYEKLLKYVDGWDYQAPLICAPYLTKSEMLNTLATEGIRLPNLYVLGFAHNNCGGFCCKAGHTHFRLRLKKLPERFAQDELDELRLRSLGINGTILVDRRGGVKKPMTLHEFRLREESGGGGVEDDLAQGCGCALPI